MRRRFPRPARASGPGGVSVGVLLDRLATLLEAGLAPAVAWRRLAESVPDPVTRPLLDGVAQALERGSPGASALVALAGARSGDSAGRVAEWGQVAAAWQVAETCGAPIGPALRTAAASLRSATQARRDAAVALSGPVATARVVLVLPVLGIALGLVMGIDSLGVLFGTPVGWFCLAGATGLIAVARAWNSRLVLRATPSPGLPALDLDLVALALGGGGDWSSAETTVDRAIEECCPDSILRSPFQIRAEVRELSQAAGIPGAGLLRLAADEIRHDARARTRIAGEKLGVALMLPLGLCVLPSFLLVGVVPLFVALLSSTVR